MPLNKECSWDAFEENVRELSNSPVKRTRSQIMAIAYNTLDRACGGKRPPRRQAKGRLKRTYEKKGKR